jgi:hypothetical protein
MKQNKIILNADRASMIEFTETIVRTEKLLLRVSSIMLWCQHSLQICTKRKKRNRRRLRCFSSAWSILKSLNLTEEDWPENYTLIIIMSFKCVWSYDDWEVAPLREEGTDHQIELKEMNERVKSTLRFSIQHDEKEATVAQDINRTLNKQFIWVSNSSAAVSVLFIQKSEDELQFCVNYCDLTESLKESLLSFIDIWDSAKHQMSSMIHQVECHSAFHKIWIAAEDKWKSILYEVQVVWMNDDFFWASQCLTFQRYINWALQNFLNEFCSVYVNDILIHWWIFASTPKSCTKILLWLWEVSLQIDIDKCEFEVKSIKYLEFILKVKKAYKWISKDEAIMNWQAFKSVKSVQSFIDFATFIESSSRTFLIWLCQWWLYTKNTSFKWTESWSRF